jgi:hypothetical protein
MAEETKVETISGFDIPKRELTQEEKKKEITIERIRGFHYDAGEDLLDQVGYEFGNAFIFGGFVLHKYKEHSKMILDHINQNINHLDIHCFNELEIYEYNDEDDMDGIYYDLVEFLNLTENAKERANQILIQVDEYYNK